MERKASILIALVAAIMLLAGYSTAMAKCGDSIDLRDASGALLTNDTTPYSPKQSCSSSTSSCHIAGVTKTLAQTGGDVGSHNYGSGIAMSTHVQGVLGSATDTTLYWQAYQNKSFAHGVSVGRHMNQGRNETYTNTARAQYGDLFFTSSPGMYGKY